MLVPCEMKYKRPKYLAMHANKSVNWKSLSTGSERLELHTGAIMLTNGIIGLVLIIRNCRGALY